MAARKAPFLLGCRISPGWRVSGEGQGSVLHLREGRFQMLVEETPVRALPHVPGWKSQKGASRNPSFSAPLETPTWVGVRLLAG